MWKYAELSKNACEAGGPEAYISSIEDSSKELGREEGQVEGFISGLLFAAATAAIGWLGYKGCILIKKKQKEKRARLQERIDDSKLLATEILENSENNNCEEASQENEILADQQ